MYVFILNRLGDFMWGGVVEVGNVLCLVRLYIVVVIILLFIERKGNKYI